MREYPTENPSFGFCVVLYMEHSLSDDTISNLQELAKLLRYYSLISTTEAGSGHATSSLSAADLMAGLMFGGLSPRRIPLKAGEGGFFRFDPDTPEYANNDRLIFSKGHASPLFYSLWAVAGVIPVEELKRLRKFGSPLEGHPTMAFPYTEAATGSLGQGLSIGVGMAMNAKYLDKLPYRTFVLLGDSEMAEGSVWEAAGIAAYYKLNNLIAVLDVNRLGQRGQTMHGHDVDAYKKKLEAFGWETVVIDGHDMGEIVGAYEYAVNVADKPVVIIAKTMKGKGVSFLEDKDGWHGKALNKEELEKALGELGEVDTSLHGSLAPPAQITIHKTHVANAGNIEYPKDKPVATRKAYGNALVRIFPQFPNMVALDAEVSNSTFAEIFKNAHPDRFFEMFIAEQNMVGAAIGFSRRGKIPFVSTFAAFFTRAFDQIRMSQYSNVYPVRNKLISDRENVDLSVQEPQSEKKAEPFSNGAGIKFVGSHVGVSIGEDGASQMGLEDIAMFRTLLDSVVLYPSDAVSTEKLVEEAARHTGIVYIRTTRKDTPLLYGPDEEFPIGGSKTLRASGHDRVTIIGAGITLHEAHKAYDELAKQGIAVRVIDLYSIKPIDTGTLKKAARETGAIITVEDHFAEGGIGEAVRSALDGETVTVKSLAVRKTPRSGKPEELLDYEEISAKAIVATVKDLNSALNA